MAKGIDYGLGLTNIDTKTRIRFGVISQHSLASWFFDDYEPQYGDPTCPKCGNPAKDVGAHGADYLERIEDYDQDHGYTDYACDDCRYVFDSSDAYPEDPIGHVFQDDEYTAEDCLDSDVILVRSPYYTYAPYCSPCVPGAGNLDDAIPRDKGCPVFGCPTPTSTHDHRDKQGIVTMGFHPEDHGVKTFCFAHDYFEDRRAPYRVFRVSDDSEVLPDVELFDGL